MKSELLVPAGNMETLKCAINGGADAIYLGGKKFGARAFAPNFTNEEIKEAICLCHLYGVKIYITINTVIFENEIDEFINFVKFLYENGVDALIVQDIGMIKLIKKLFPNFEIHSSTQMHTHNNYCIKLLKKLGVSRAVLAREMNLEDIKKLDKDIEIEVFIHGALCVSYSGCCLFSSMNGGRSGNRGACVGSCRLPYKLLENGKEIKTEGDYVLSTKDLCSVYTLKDLLDSGINSLKIEGRMKSPEYVRYVTYIYRKLIDNYFNGKDMVITDDEINNLKKLFNREFTKGYLFNEDIYNNASQNHLGTKLGKVIKCNKNFIYLKLEDDLYQEDAIRFMNLKKGMIINKLYNENGLLTNKVEKENIALIDNKIGLTESDIVNKTIDNNLIKTIKNMPSKKIEIDFNVVAEKNKPLQISISDSNNIITKKFITLETALKKPTTKEEIYNKLNKLGNTPFALNKLDIKLDKVFIPMTILNEARRVLCEELIKGRTSFSRNISIDYQKNNSTCTSHNINVLVRNEEQLITVLNKANNIYITDYDLYQKYKDKNIFYKVPRVNYEEIDFKNENLLVSDLGVLYKFSKDNNIITDYTLNICNSESINILNKLGSQQITLSPEIPTNLINTLQTDSTEVIVYGRLELMALKTFKYEGSKLSLKDKFGNIFPIINDSYTSIMHFKNIDLTKENIKGNIRIELFNESPKEINDILNNLI